MISGLWNLQDEFQVAGEQMRHGLKPCDTASDPVEKPTRFLVEMRLTQSQFST